MKKLEWNVRGVEKNFTLCILSQKILGSEILLSYTQPTTENQNKLNGGEHPWLLRRNPQRNQHQKLRRNPPKNPPAKRSKRWSALLDGKSDARCIAGFAIHSLKSLFLPSRMF
jgi:hypothetical protein